MREGGREGRREGEEEGRREGREKASGMNQNQNSFILAPYNTQEQ